eukprot:gene5170-5989_t
MDEIQQHWLYALSAPIVSINPGAGYLEPAFYAGPSPIDLEGSWGINDRDQLFGMLSLADNGHARHLNEAYHQWVTVGETAKQCGIRVAPPSSAGECFASCMVGVSENGKHLNLQTQKAAAHQENPVQLIPMKWPGAFASVPA